MVSLKKMFNEEIICHLKRRLKRFCIASESLIHIIAKFKKKWHVLQITKTHFSYSIWSMISEKLPVPWYGVHVFHHGGSRMYQESQQTRYTKKFVYKKFQFFQPLIIVPSCVLVIFMDINTYILTERKEFQNILESKKIMQLVWTAVTCLIMNMRLNMILLVLMEFARIRHP